MVARAETASAALLIILVGRGDWTRNLQAARGGEDGTHGQVGQPQVVLLPSNRDDHGEAAKVSTEGVTVDGEGAVVLNKLEHMGLARDLDVLGFAVKEKCHLVHHIAVEKSKHTAKAEVWSHLSNLNSWRSTVDEHISLPSSNSDPHQGVEESFVPNTVHPEFPGGTSNLDSVRDAIQNQLRV